MSRLARLWRLLTEAPTAVSEPGRRREIQLLSSLLVVLVALGTLSMLIQVLLDTESWPTYVAEAVALAVLGLAYGLGRTGRFTAAALLTVGVSTTACFTIAIFEPRDATAYALLFVNMFLARLLFNKAGVWTMMAVNLVGVILLLPALGAPLSSRDIVMVSMFLVLVAALLWLGARHRDAVEHDRRAALSASEARLNEAQRISQLGSWELDLANNRLTWSDEIFRMFGIDRSRFDSSYEAFLAAVHPEDRETVRRAYAESVRNHVPYEITHRLLLPGGDVKYVHERCETVYAGDGTPLRSLGTVQDITARVEAERALRESENDYRALIENANVGILVNHRGRHVFANSRLLAMLGYSADELRQTGIQELVHPDEYQKVMERFRDRHAGRPAPNVYETVFVTRDGQPVPVELTATLTHWEGEPAGLVFLQDIRERKAAEAALRESEARFRTLSEVSFEGIFIHDQGRIVDCNPTFAAMLGYTPDEIRRLNAFDLVTREYHDVIREAMQEGYNTSLEVQAVHKDGSTFPVEVFGKPLVYQGRAMRVASVRDLSTRRRSEAQMRKLSGAVEQAADAIMITDRAGTIEYVNPAFERTTGYSRAEAIGRTPRLVKSGRQGAGFYEGLWRTILAGEVFSDVFINRRKDGALYYEEKTITPLKDREGRVTHFISTGKDVTERMQTQERLQYMAQHDALTELPNRLLLLDRLKQSLARARWHQRLVAILFIDLDRFKTINDTLGHEAGDRLLQLLAERFNRAVREGDTVARFGGDEFVILLDDVATEQDVGMVAQKVLDALAAPFNIENQGLYITASIGVSLFPGDGEDSGALLKNADVAMYRAKELGKNTYQFYSADMSARAFERLSLETSLRHALERNEFLLYYQPQLDVDSGEIVGVEALLRWRHPDFGLVLPGEFIALLEETGLILPAGEWILQTACAQLRAWHAAGRRKLRLAVNLSPRQVQAPGLVAMVERALNGMRADAGRLELEITEGLLVQHAPATMETFEALRALGVRLAVDDFGTGYSSLSYLRRFPIDTLKIDRSFVHDIPHDPDDSAITTTIIAMAQGLRLEVVAEGVENAAQRDFLRSRGCRLMQGYLFSRPLPADKITKLLKSNDPKS